MLTATAVTGAGHPLAAVWWQLYEETFPITERRSARQHAAALADASFHCLHLADKSGFVGLLAYWRWDDIVYVEHLAIDAPRRGQGLGHQVLALLQGKVILEIEPVVDEITARRLSFYESGGFTRLPQAHVQQPYQVGQPDVPLWLMSRPRMTDAEVARFEELYHSGPMHYRDR